MFLKTQQVRILHSRGLSKKVSGDGMDCSGRVTGGVAANSPKLGEATQGRDLTQRYQLWWIDRLVLADANRLRGSSQNQLQSENKQIT